MSLKVACVVKEALEFCSSMVLRDEGHKYWMQDHIILHNMAIRAKRKAYESWSVFDLSSALNALIMVSLFCSELYQLFNEFIDSQHLGKKEVNLLTDKLAEEDQPNKIYC